MAEPQPSLTYQFLRRLLSQLGPREASAEIIKADEGTRTIKGEEDIAAFRALIKRMIDEAVSRAPQTSTSTARKLEGQRSQEKSSDEEKAPEDLVTSAREMQEPEVPLHYGEQGYTSEDMRALDAGQNFVEYLLKQGFMKPENLGRFQGENITEITSRSPVFRHLYDVYQQEQDRERLK